MSAFVQKYLKPRTIEHLLLDSRILRLEKQIKSLFYSLNTSVSQRLLDLITSVFCKKLEFQSGDLGKSVFSYLRLCNTNLDALLERKQTYLSLLKSVIDQKSPWQWRSLRYYLCFSTLGAIPSLLFGLWRKLRGNKSAPAVSPQKQDDVSLLEAAKSVLLLSSESSSDSSSGVTVVTSSLSTSGSLLNVMNESSVDQNVCSDDSMHSSAEDLSESSGNSEAIRCDASSDESTISAVPNSCSGNADMDPLHSGEGEAEGGERKAETAKAETAKAETAKAETAKADKTRRGLVVVDGNHHTIAVATLSQTNIKFSKTIKIRNKHRRGGQSQNRFQRLADESRDNHIKIIKERMMQAFLDKNGKVIVEEIVVAGPGPMKSLLREELPQVLAKLVTRVISINRSGRPGLYDLTQILCGKLQEHMAGNMADIPEPWVDEQSSSSEEKESFSSAQFEKDELARILQKQSKFLKKEIGADYCQQMNSEIIAKFLEFQNEVDLRKVDVKKRRASFLASSRVMGEEEIAQDTAWRVLEILQKKKLLGGSD